MDLILGQFADENIDKIDESELMQFENLLDIDDRDLYQWVTGEVSTPAEHDSELFRKICSYGRSGRVC